MRDLISKLWSLHQIRYLVVAGSVSLWYLIVLWVTLQFGVFYMIAIFVAQAVAIATGFPLYRTLVFESKGGMWGDFVRFLTVWGTGAIAGIVGTPFLVEVFGANPFWAQVGVIVVVAVASYLGHRFFSFRHRDAHGTPAAGADSRSRPSTD